MKSIIESYFPKPVNAPFASAKEERGEFLLFMDMLCLISVQLAENEKEESISRIGAIFSNEDLVHAIEPHEVHIFPYVKEVRKVYEGLLHRANLTVENPTVFAPVSRLFCSGLLTPVEQLAFLLSMAFHSSEKYGQMFSKLTGKASDKTYPTLGLCLDFGRLFLSEEENDLAILLKDTSFLFSVLLENPNEKKESIIKNQNSLSQPLLLKETVCKWLSEVSLDDNDLNLVGEFLTPVEDGIYVCHEDLLQEIFHVVSYKDQMTDDAGSVIEICGKQGSGKRFLLSRMSEVSSIPVFALDGVRLLALSEKDAMRIVDKLCVRSALIGNLIYIYNVSEKDRQLYLYLSKLFSQSDTILIGCEKRLSEEFYYGISDSIYRISVPDANTKAQYLLWEEAAGEYAVSFEKEVDLWEIVSKFTLTPGRIFTALKNAVEVSEVTEEGFRVTKEELERQIRSICSVGFGENAKRISSPFNWEDLIIEDESKKMLQMAMDRIRFKGRVNDGFGFGEKLPYGRGVSIVLYGPPGTGKTMAAGVLAKELGLDLYRIDLSQISSKYIGETEKNLGAIFDAAENSNVILFFDEADSVFARRTNVTSSNDRHANEQTGYLLQKIEEYPGISILATNNMQNFDAAFKRRMTYLIPIGIPDEATRAKIWRESFPKQAPLSKQVDFEVLSKACEISGSSIKSAAIQAAYFAASQNREITMDDIACAVDLECTKVGKLGMKNEILSAMLKK